MIKKFASKHVKEICIKTCERNLHQNMWKKFASKHENDLWWQSLPGVFSLSSWSDGQFLCIAMHWFRFFGPLLSVWFQTCTCELQEGTEVLLCETLKSLSNLFLYSIPSRASLTTTIITCILYFCFCICISVLNPIPMCCLTDHHHHHYHLLCHHCFQHHSYVIWR